MDTWTVALPPEVDAELDELPEDLHDAALALLDSLRDDPFPPDHVKLVGDNDLLPPALGWMADRVSRESPAAAGENPADPSARRCLQGL